MLLAQTAKKIGPAPLSDSPWGRLYHPSENNIEKGGLRSMEPLGTALVGLMLQSKPEALPRRGMGVPTSVPSSGSLV
jgi:hypothetical protein